jgi:hypothetical protein
MFVAQETVTNDGDGLQLFANTQRSGTTHTWVVLMFGYRALPLKYMAGVGFVSNGNSKTATNTIMANMLSFRTRYIDERRTPFQVIAVNLHDSTWLTQFFTFVNGVTTYVLGYGLTGTMTERSLKAELATVLKHDAGVFNPSVIR